MIDIDLGNDENLQEAVNPFISSLLPHENYNAMYFTQNLTILLRYIEIDEFKLEYRLLVKALVSLNRLKMSLDSFVPQLTQESFEDILSTSICDAIMDETLGVKEWLQFEGDNTNLSIDSVREEAQQKLCMRAVDLYTTCFDLAEPSDTVVNKEPALKAAFVEHVSINSINIQHAIMRNTIRIGRRRYHGYEDWLKYTGNVVSEVRHRLTLAEDEDAAIDSVEGSLALLSDLKNSFIPIADWGIPPLDNYTPILRHRLVVVVGQENIGKTKFVIDKAVNVMKAGRRVVYMCGETTKAKIYADIIVNYVYKTYEMAAGYPMIIRPEHIISDDIDENVKKAIRMTIDTISHDGLLVLKDSFDYSTCYDELVSEYEKQPFDMVVIDHSCALSGSVGDGSVKSNIDRLASDTREFRKKYPVCVLVTSHPSQLAKEDLVRDRASTGSPTKGSQNLSTDADEVFFLRDNETLRKQGLIKLENTKRRNANCASDIILRKAYHVNAVIYDPELQADSEKENLERKEALRSLTENLEQLNDTSDADFI